MMRFIKNLLLASSILLAFGTLVATPTVSARNPNNPDPEIVNPAENPSSSPSEDTEDADVPTIDRIEDPALDEEANCDKNYCSIVQDYINPFITLLTVVVGIAVVLGIIIGGIQVATSAGDPQQAASGKGHIQNGLIAMVAYLILYSFLQWVIPGGFL